MSTSLPGRGGDEPPREREVSIGERVRPDRLGTTRPSRAPRDRARRGPYLGPGANTSPGGTPPRADTVAVAAAWLLTLLAPWHGRSAFYQNTGALLIAIPAITIGSLALIASQRLYL